MTYDGTWTARVQGQDGKWREATVVIDGYGATWQDRAGGPRICGGKKMPITFQNSTRTVVAFIVWGVKADPACPNLTVLVRPAGDRILEGRADQGVVDREPDEVAPVGAASAAGRAKIVGTAGTIRLTRR